MTSLIHKTTGEWGVYIGDGNIGTSDVPKLMGAGVTKQDLIVYSKRIDNIDITDKLEDYEIVEVEVIIKK